MLTIPAIARAQDSQILPQEAPQFDMERNIAVRDRQQPAYDPQNVHLGGWTLSPAISLQAIYDDNIFATENGRVGDMAMRIQPDVTLQSNWGRDSISLHAKGTIDRYANHMSEDVADVDVGATGVLEVGDGTKLRGGVRYQDQHQARQSQDVFTQSVKPIRYSRTGMAVAASQDLGRIRLSTDAIYTRNNYHDGMLADGSPVQEDTSDNHEWRLGARASYAPSPAVAFFVCAEGDWRTFKLGTADTPRRDSHGYQFLGGVQLEPAALLRGSIGIGYIRQNFTNHFYGDLSGVAVNAKLEFFPTQLTTVTVAADRQVLDSGIPGVGGYLSTDVSLNVDHELLRQLILGASVGYQHNLFNHIDRRDDRVTASARADWRINRVMAVEVRFDRLNQISLGANRYLSYADNRLLLGVTFRK